MVAALRNLRLVKTNLEEENEAEEGDEEEAGEGEDEEEAKAMKKRR